jgi:transcriptional regulator with XRE-family HTH domain
MKPVQSRMARAALDWSTQDLARFSDVGVNTINRFEGGQDSRMSSVEKLQRALETAGVIFVPENGDGPGVRLRKREDRKNLDRHIEHLEGEVAHLKPVASGKPSPETGMAMLRRGRAKNDLASAKNKRAKALK